MALGLLDELCFWFVLIVARYKAVVLNGISQEPHIIVRVGGDLIHLIIVKHVETNDRILNNFPIFSVNVDRPGSQ